MEFISRFPPECGIAFLLADSGAENDPTVEEGLSRRTITLAQNGDVPEVEGVYVAPSGHCIRLIQGRFLNQPLGTEYHNETQMLLEGLGESLGNRSVAVLLPGVGGDAERGAKAVTEANGHIFTIIESADPMVGRGEHQLLGDEESVNSVVQSLLSMADVGGQYAGEGGAGGLGPFSPSFLQMLRICRDVAEMDFSGYRPDTLLRRVSRRLNMKGGISLPRYVESLSRDRDEVLELCADLLVSVTWFFREPRVWQRVQDLLPEIVERAIPRNALRVWVAGCGTGQEAYTLGILIDQELKSRGISLEVKIFATDVNGAIVARAAEGCYTPAEVSMLPRETLLRYFSFRQERWWVKPILRRKLLFSRHDIIAHPPFIHLDILSCRNLMMYLDTSVQKAVGRTFAKSLDDQGLLILGPVESIHTSLPFTPHPGISGLLSKQGNPASLILEKAEIERHPTVPSPRLTLRPGAAKPIRQLIEDNVATVLARRGTLVLVIDGFRQVVGMVGQTDQYLRFAQGPASRELGRVLRPELLAPMTTLIERVRTIGERAVGRGSFSKSDGTLLRLRLTVEYEDENSSREDATVVAIIEHAPVLLDGESEASPGEAGGAPQQDGLVEELENELALAQDMVRHHLERLTEAEVAHKATREQMMTANEELQSANEELHSVNQELFAVNAELQNKIEQLTQLGSDVDSLLQSTAIATIFLEKDLRVRKFTDSVESIFNLMTHDVGRPLLHITHSLVDFPDLEEVLKAVTTTGCNVEREVSSKAGRIYLLRVLPYYSEANSLAGAVLTFVDVTRLKETEAALRQKETQLREVINLVPHQLYAKDISGCFVLANQTTADFYSLSIDQIQGRREVELAVSEDQAQFIEEHDRRVIESGERVFLPEETRIDRNGQRRIFQTTKIPIKGSDSGPLLLGISLDITEQKRVEAELRHRALYDMLTGLPNRDLFTERLNHSLQRLNRRNSSGFAILFLDLDSFKEINDTMGHVAGDELLGAVAQRLSVCARPGDTVARFGGDEFAILLENVNSSTVGDIVAQRVHQALEGTFNIQDSQFVVSTSIGIAFPMEGETDCEALMQQADVAMYEAKRAGPGNSRVFSSEMSTKLGRMLELRLDLHQALERSELVLHYQPIVHLTDHSLKGFEVLVRWNHPTQGLLSPDTFLPVARSAGLMCRIDEWVISEACAQLRLWLDAFSLSPDTTMSLNVCGEHLQRTDLVDFFGSIIAKHAIPRESLVVELTESSVLHAPAQAAYALGRLREMDIGVALDDFGTGYSSLNHLRQLPLGILKVDRSFTSHLGDERRTTHIVRTLVELADNLGLKVVAEGIELESQEQILLGFGCHYGQGYLYSKPMNVDMMTQFLEDSLGLKVPGVQ